jgi:hypothetical protein
MVRVTMEKLEVAGVHLWFNLRVGSPWHSNSQNALISLPPHQKSASDLPLNAMPSFHILGYY